MDRAGAWYAVEVRKPAIELSERSFNGATCVVETFLGLEQDVF
jgi:hypothetical protein